MQKLILFLPALLLLLGCSGETETQQESLVDSFSVKDTLEIPVPEKNKTELSATDYNKVDTLIRKFITRLDSTYDNVPYFTKIYNQIIFYVCNGKWKNPEDGKFFSDDIQMGLVNEKFEILLEPVYSKIFNPDATVKGFIEIEQKGKRGLFNYQSKEILSPQFDVIFPSHIPGFIAIGKKGDDYVGITSDLQENPVEDIPSYSSLGLKWNFDIKSQDIIYLYYSYNDEYEEGEPVYGNGVVFTPSYFYHLGFLPEIVDGIGKEEKVDFALTGAEGKILKSVSISDKITALISSFYEEGVDARGWQITENRLITIDSRNNVISNEHFFTSSMGDFYMCNINGFNFLEESIFEVYETEHTDEDYTAYDYMTCYSYYKINPGGKVEPLKSDRKFDFTKFILLEERHFKGCFAKHRKDDNGNYESTEEGNMWLSEHLSIEDLDLMRNEIFAEYGMRFKTDKWRQYFSKQPWYKPQYDNVDQFLTEIDKENIKTILSVKEKMKGKEEHFTNKRLEMYAPAG